MVASTIVCIDKGLALLVMWYVYRVTYMKTMDHNDLIFV